MWSNKCEFRKILLIAGYAARYQMPIATDARHRQVVLEAPPRRIVSLVPSQTELLADLGLEEEVVGLTRFCVHPDGWKRSKQIVGGTKQVNVERIHALRPDLILANLEENTREMVEALDPVAPVYVTDVRDVPGALSMIRAVGYLTGRTDAAGVITREIEGGFDALPGFASLRAVYLIWRDPYMTVGADTFIHDMMARGGFVNVFGSRTRYPEITAEELRAAKADVVLLSSEPFPFREKHIPEIIDLLPQTLVRLVDGEMFSWYGSRLRKTPVYLRDLRQALEIEAT